MKVEDDVVRFVLNYNHALILPPGRKKATIL
jgi:hypothetical protein